jgi:hypothetical protein
MYVCIVSVCIASCNSKKTKRLRLKDSEWPQIFFILMELEIWLLKLKGSATA